MLTLALTPDQLAEHLKVERILPEGTSGNVEVRRVKFTETTVWPRPGQRPPPGIYTELRIDGETWMSDMPNEVHEQMAFLDALNRAPRDSNILICGLGLGVILHGALLMLHRGPIDIVEYNPDVLAVVQPAYEEAARIADVEVRFHLASAYTWKMPPDARWHIGWIDIHRDLTEANLSDLDRLEARYGPRCLWLGSWSRREGEALRRHRESGAPPIPGVPVAGVRA